MIAIAREHIQPNEAFTAVQRALADSSDHSVAIEDHHYAIKFGDIPRLSNLVISRTRWLLTEWWGVLAFSGEPLRPLVERQMFDEIDLSSRINRVVETTLTSSIEKNMASIVEGSIRALLPTVVAQVIQSMATVPGKIIFIYRRSIILMYFLRAVAARISLPPHTPDIRSTILPPSSPPIPSVSSSSSAVPEPVFAARPIANLEGRLLAKKPARGAAPPTYSPSSSVKRSPSPLSSMIPKRSRITQVQICAPLEDGGNENLWARSLATSPAHPTHEELTVVPTSVDDEIELTLPSQSLTSTSGIWPEYSLDEAVDLKDDEWQPYLQPCYDALAALGYSGPKHAKQLQAMVLVLSRKQNIIFVLPTGFGKTILTQFLAKLAGDLMVGSHFVGGNCIIISPFTALLMDQVEKCKPLAIAAFNWQTRKHPIDVPTNTRLLFIQPESFISSMFKKYVSLISIY